MGDPADGFLPCRVIGSNPDGSEGYIGDFHRGVVLKGMFLVDVDSQATIAQLAKLPGIVKNGEPIMVWEFPKHQQTWYYVFIQVMPGDAPKEIDMPGGKKQIYY